MSAPQKRVAAPALSAQLPGQRAARLAGGFVRTELDALCGVLICELLRCATMLTMLDAPTAPQKRDWLALVAVHSDCWLLAVAFYNGARLNKQGR